MGWVGSAGRCRMRATCKAGDDGGGAGFGSRERGRGGYLLRLPRRLAAPGRRRRSNLHRVASSAWFSRSRTTSARVTSRPIARIWSAHSSTRSTSPSGRRNENCFDASTANLRLDWVTPSPGVTQWGGSIAGFMPTGSPRFFLILAADAMRTTCHGVAIRRVQLVVAVLNVRGRLPMHARAASETRRVPCRPTSTGRCGRASGLTLNPRRRASGEVWQSGRAGLVCSGRRRRRWQRRRGPR